MKIPDTLCTQVSVTRLHNLGDYEHAKYEVTLLVASSEIGDYIAKLDDILKRLKPVREPYNLAHALVVFDAGAQCNQDGEEDDIGSMSFDVAEKIVREYRIAREARQRAIEELNALGATLEGKL